MQRSNPWQFRLRERRILLITGDLLMAGSALVLALYDWGRTLRFIEFNFEFLRDRVPGWFYLLPLIWLLLLIELYDTHRSATWRETLTGIGAAALIGLVMYLGVFFYYAGEPSNLLPRRGVAVFLGFAASLTLLWRWFYIRIFNVSTFMRRVLLVGGGQSGRLLLEVIQKLPTPPFLFLGIVDDDPGKQNQSIHGLQVIGSSEHLLKILIERNITDLIVAISGNIQPGMFQALLEAQEIGVEITRMPIIYEELLGRVPILMLESDWILRSFVDYSRAGAFYELGKRLMDILGGFVGVLLFILVLPFLALAILLDDGRPIFYSQTRSGRGGLPYQILKFRTMRRDAEADGKPRWAKEDDERATRAGKFLRKTHLDELPQFLNVLIGDMSLVGPRAERPELVQMFQQHVPFYRARLMVKPGITGWAQVNFGYASTVDETVVKLEYDLYYIKHRNLIMDLLIMMKTPATVLGFRGR